MTTAFSSPSHRCRPGIRRVLFTLGAVFTAVALSSCAGVPSPSPAGDAESWRHTSLSADDRAFLDAADTRFSGLGTTGQEGPRGSVFFSFASAPAAREHVREVFPEAGDLLPRINRGVAVLSSGYPTLLLETDVSRFSASVALNVDRWTRTDWGRWCAPDGTVSVTFLPGRRWLVTPGCGHGAPVPPQLPAGFGRETPFPRLPDVPGPTGPGPTAPDQTAARRIGVFAAVDDPDFSGIPERFQPREMRFVLYDDSNAEMVLLFPDERAARVALVPIRLRAETVLSSYGFVPGETFDIFRWDARIGIVGVSIEKLAFPESVLTAE